MNNRKARLILFFDCPRKCEKCCNTDNSLMQQIKHIKFTDLLNYSEIYITGGEPLLEPNKVLALIQALKKANYTGKIGLYTANYMPKSQKDEKYIDAVIEIIKLVDGLQYTMHKDTTLGDITHLQQFTALLNTYAPAYHALDYRLNIDEYWYDTIVDYTMLEHIWKVIKKMVWKDNCPLPVGEDLVMLED